MHVHGTGAELPPPSLPGPLADLSYIQTSAVLHTSSMHLRRDAFERNTQELTKLSLCMLQHVGCKLHLPKPIDVEYPSESEILIMLSY